MTVKCVGALLARNEAAPDRYLKRALANATQFCDAIVVLDDGSSDGTTEVCEAAGAKVVKRGVDGGWWGAASEQSEAPARAALWNLAVAEADGGWVYVFDADHELVGIEPARFRALLSAEHVTAWACPLWDCWGDDGHMRVDGFWQAYLRPRVWLARALGPWPSEGILGPARAIHVGHLPSFTWNVGIMPDGAAIRHLGYVQREHRLAKYRNYVNLQA